MRISGCLWALLLTCVCATCAEAGQTFTLEQAVQYAMKANPGIESKVLQLEQAKMNIGVAQSYFWPRVWTETWEGCRIRQNADRSLASWFSPWPAQFQALLESTELFSLVPEGLSECGLTLGC